VQENVLYRLWPDKKAMFVASLGHVYEPAEESWIELVNDSRRATSAAERILEHEALHHGETGLYRLVFAGLSETDDAQIRAALRRLYGRFQRFIAEQIALHRGRSAAAEALPSAELAAWAIVGLGSVANIGRELGLLPARARKELLSRCGTLVLGGRAG
jgi:AcrR family transcriptional regulator